MRKLPNRVWNSPIIRYANLKGGHHINLIELKKPYANGRKFAIHATDDRYTSSMHNSLKRAWERFDLMVCIAKHKNELVELGEIDHSKPYPNHKTIIQQEAICTS